MTQRGDSILSIAIEIRMAKLHELIEPLTEEQLMQLIHLSDVLYNASRSLIHKTYFPIGWYILL